MKKSILSLLLLMFSIFCFAQNVTSDCAKFRTGRFQYIDASKVVTVKRTKHVQEELIVNTGAKTRLHIRWVEDCVYDLRQVWTNNKEKRKMNGSVTRVKITKTYDNRYDYTCACRDSASINNNSGTIFIVK